MEKFKAVEKEMKTKAYSKEGLSAASKLDPKEKEKLDACQFLSSMVEELERQIETVEAEAESLQANMKKGKKDASKADRIAEIERMTERHKWHQGKLEQILRSLENGAVEVDQITELEESIKYYVENNQDVDFMEDDAIYDDLNLEEEEEGFGLTNDNDRLSSQDTQSVQDEPPEIETRGPSIAGGKSKSSSISDPPGASARRPSTHAKSPLPALATLHNTSTSTTNGAATSSMKPAPLPTRAPGETLKYASAAAAAAASDKNGVGIAPLPPPPGLAGSANDIVPGLAPLPPAGPPKTTANASPNVAPSQPTSVGNASGQRAGLPPSVVPSESAPPTRTQARSPASGPSTGPQGGSVSGSVSASVSRTPASEYMESTAMQLPRVPAAEVSTNQNRTISAQFTPPKELAGADARAKAVEEAVAGQTNGGPESLADDSIGTNESIYHLPPGLQDLAQSFEATKSRVLDPNSESVQRMIAASYTNAPDASDAEKPRHYKPTTRYNTAPHYPQEPLPTLEDHRLYSRVDTDTLFYVFYYRQGTYQQYLAAKALKNQSWRFHKQYQTWFQRHEEPKTITEEYEQGTYRFFDYESTWSV